MCRCGWKIEQHDVLQRLESVGMDVEPSRTLAPFHELVRTDVAKWKKVVQEAEISLD